MVVLLAAAVLALVGLAHSACVGAITRLIDQVWLFVTRMSEFGQSTTFMPMNAPVAIAV